MWVARDKNGSVWIYNTKPVKFKHEWVNPNGPGGYSMIDEELDDLANIRWEDSEPTELILKR